MIAGLLKTRARARPRTAARRRRPASRLRPVRSSDSPASSRAACRRSRGRCRSTDRADRRSSASRSRARRRSRKASTIGFSTIARLVAVQRCPVEKNAAFNTQSTATSRSASASTMVGFLPPISSCTRASRSAPIFAMPRPTASEPVNEMARTFGCATSGIADVAARAGDEVEHALRNAGFMQDLDEPHARERRLRRRLDHHGVAGDQRGRELPRRDGDGEVPGRDQRDHAERLADGVHEHARPLGRNRVAREARAFAAEIFEDADGARHLALRLGDRLAFLAAEQIGHVVEPRFEQLRGLQQDLAAHGRRRRRPRRGTRVRQRRRPRSRLPGRRPAAAAIRSRVSAGLTILERACRVLRRHAIRRR